jgi:hypothetical protein
MFFILPPKRTFLKTILASRTFGTFGFALHTSQPFAKPKELFFAKAQGKYSYFVPLVNNIL